MRILKALLLPFLLVVSLIGVDKLHAPHKPYYQGRRGRPPKQHTACPQGFLRWVP